MTGNETQGPRGEAAWKAHLERVAARNAETRRVAKQQRQEKDRLERARRSAQELRMDTELARTFERNR
jgi:hypothetical protein